MNIFSEYILLMVMTKGQMPPRLGLFEGFACLCFSFLSFRDYQKVKQSPCHVGGL